MTSTQPISLPPQNDVRARNDYSMASGSYSASTSAGSFNPASYTRHFLGSPMSFRMSSNGVYPSSVPMGSPMDQLRGSLESRDPAVTSALKIFEFQSELCKHYTCCGLHLTDLHALLEHFEEVHIVVVDPHPGQPHGQPQTRISVPFEPQVVGVGGVAQPMQYEQQGQRSNPHYPTPVDPDDMELELPTPPPSSAASNATTSIPSSPVSTPSPPDTLLSTPLSPYSSPVVPPMTNTTTSSLAAAYPGGYPGTGKSQPSPPLQNNNNAQRPSLALNVAAFSSSTASRTGSGLHSPFITSAPQAGAVEPFHPFGRYVEYTSTPGGVDMSFGTTGYDAFGLNTGIEYAYSNSNTQGATSGGYMYSNQMQHHPASGHSGQRQQQQQQQGDQCVQPALLFSNANTPESERDADGEFDIDVEEQKPQLEQQATTVITAATSSKSAAALHRSASEKSGVKSEGRTIGRPPTTSLLQSKPFKCPKPNCNKSYKQANGLKYHMTHGSCNFAPPKDLEHVQALLEKKRKQQQQAQEEGAGSVVASTSTSVANSTVASGANTPSGIMTPATGTGSGSAPPSTVTSPFASALSSPVVPHSANPFTAAGGGSPSGSGSGFAPTPSSLSTALSAALCLGSGSGAGASGSSSVAGSSSNSGSSQNTATGGGASSQSQSTQAPSLQSTLSSLSSLPESELRDLEREAEKRLRPFACGVGDCPRRYKNMNGLRYHYQHSGEHGAVGLQWLASGKHECLSGGKHHGHGTFGGQGHAVGAGRGGEREGRKRVAGGSKPASRASSLSRTGTPTGTTNSTNTNAGAAAAAWNDHTKTQPFTPPITNPNSILQQQSQAAATSSTAATTNTGATDSTTATTTSATTTAGSGGTHPVLQTPGVVMSQAQAQLAYQQRFVEHQRAQYAQQVQAAQAQAQATQGQ